MNKQLIPFPLPEHLSEFVVSQMNTPAELLEDGTKAKALHIRKNSEFGKMIQRCLRKSNKPAFVKEGFTVYIAISENARRRDKKAVDARSSFMDLDEEEIKEIISVFETWFKTCLFHFIDGAVFGHKFNGKTKGIVHASIEQFMDYYKISHHKRYFEAFRKHYQREKKAQRQQLQRLT